MTPGIDRTTARTAAESDAIAPAGGRSKYLRRHRALTSLTHHHDVEPAAEETARRDGVLSNACVDEYLHQPEVGPVEGAAPLNHPCVAQPEQWWPNPGEDPVASFGGVSVSYGALPAVA